MVTEIGVSLLSISPKFDNLFLDYTRNWGGLFIAAVPLAILAMMLLLGTGIVYASTLPGTRMKVDWPKLISGQDIILTTPPDDPVSGLLMGNGDIGVSVFGSLECITLQVGKNDKTSKKELQSIARSMRAQLYILIEQLSTEKARFRDWKYGKLVPTDYGNNVPTDMDDNSKIKTD